MYLFVYDLLPALIDDGHNYSRLPPKRNYHSRLPQKGTIIVDYPKKGTMYIRAAGRISQCLAAHEQATRGQRAPGEQTQTGTLQFQVCAGFLPLGILLGCCSGT